MHTKWVESRALAVRRWANTHLLWPCNFAINLSFYKLCRSEMVVRDMECQQKKYKRFACITDFCSLLREAVGKIALTNQLVNGWLVQHRWIIYCHKLKSIFPDNYYYYTAHKCILNGVNRNEYMIFLIPRVFVPSTAHCEWPTCRDFDCIWNSIPWRVWWQITFVHTAQASAMPLAQGLRPNREYVNAHRLHGIVLTANGFCVLRWFSKLLIVRNH